MMNPDDDDSVVERDERLADTPLVRCHGCKRMVRAGGITPDDACISTVVVFHWMCRAVNPSGRRES